MFQEQLVQTFSYRKLICCNSNKTHTTHALLEHTHTHAHAPWERVAYSTWIHFKRNILKVFSYFVSWATDVLLNMNVSIRSGLPQPSVLHPPRHAYLPHELSAKTQRQTKTLSSACSGAQGTMSTSTWHQPVTRRSFVYLCLCLCAFVVVVNAQFIASNIAELKELKGRPGRNSSPATEHTHTPLLHIHTHRSCQLSLRQAGAHSCKVCSQYVYICVAFQCQLSMIPWCWLTTSAAIACAQVLEY